MHEIKFKKFIKTLKKYTIEIVMILIAVSLAIIYFYTRNQILLNISYSYWASCMFYFIVVLIPKIRNELNYSKTIESEIDLLLRQLKKMFSIAFGQIFYKRKLSQDEIYSICENRKLLASAGYFHNGVSRYTMTNKDAIYSYYTIFLNVFRNISSLSHFIDSKIVSLFQDIVNSAWTVSYTALGGEIGNENLKAWQKELYEVYELYCTFVKYYNGKTF